MRRRRIRRVGSGRRREATAAAGRVRVPVGLIDHPEASPRLSGGDVDADWSGAYAIGEEGVGGSVATPDQDMVDELGEALGVPQELDAPFRTSGEILRERDRHRWTLERKAELERRRRSRP